MSETISQICALEQSIPGKSLIDLQVRLALRGCLRELRELADYSAAFPGNETLSSAAGVIHFPVSVAASPR